VCQTGFVVPVHQARNGFLGSLKGLQIPAVGSTVHILYVLQVQYVQWYTVLINRWILLLKQSYLSTLCEFMK
jgi:hypothetical protein